jgi:hypothetical protein
VIISTDMVGFEQAISAAMQHQNDVRPKTQQHSKKEAKGRATLDSIVAHTDDNPTQPEAHSGNVVLQSTVGHGF